MIDQVGFMHTSYLWPVVLVAVVLLGVFIWKEYSQSGTRNLMLKVLLILLVIASLAGIALKPTIPVPNDAATGIVVTEGYKQAELDSLRETYKKSKILKYDPYRSLQDTLKAFDTVFVLGEGIRSFDLWQLENVQGRYLEGKTPHGVLRLKYPREVSVGQPVIVNALINEPEPGNRLVLQGPGEIALDSVSFGSAERQTFQLRTETKVAGNFLFTLVEKDSLGNQLSSDPVPVKVKGKEPLKILVLNSFPTFETRYLKNFLAERGHKLLLRSQISRDRYKFEYYNTDRVPLGQLSEEQLESFDLLILDAKALRNLTRSELISLESSLKENGLGIFIQPEESFFTNPGKLADFKFIRNQEETANIEEWGGIDADTYRFRFQEEFGLQPIVLSGDEVLSAFLQKGRGRIGSSVFVNSWKLPLEGESTAYEHYWSEVLEKLAKKATPSVEWEADAQFAIQQEPFHFRLRTTMAAPEIRDSAGNLIPLEQDVDIPDLWKARVHPRKIGWNQYFLKQDTVNPFEFYVAENTDWEALRSFKTTQDNLRYFNDHRGAVEIRKNLQPVNQFWFLLIFILSMGGLWLEPKLKG